MSRNLSIDSYTIGQPTITGIIEDQMANLSFQGAGGWVKFNQYRSVSTPVEVFWIPDKNGTLRSVGIFNSSNTTAFRVNLNTSSLPKDCNKHYISAFQFLLPCGNSTT